MRFKHNSLRTEQAYRQWIKRFIFFHGKQHPREFKGVSSGLDWPCGKNGS
jgi:hypothetical protein